MQGLMKHDGDVCTFKQVENIFTPRPTNTHVPIPHHTLFEMTRDAMAEYGFTLENETHALSPDGQRYAGLMSIKNESTDFSTLAALMNTHDRTKSATLGLGSCTWVCLNLQLSAEIKIGRKHTAHIMRDLPGLIDGAVSKVKGFQQKQEERTEIYKSYEVRPRTGDAFLVECYRRKILSANQLSKVIKEWDTPTYEEFAQDSSMWRLTSAVTEVIKPKSTRQLMTLTSKTSKLESFADEVVGW